MRKKKVDPEIEYTKKRTLKSMVGVVGPKPSRRLTPAGAGQKGRRTGEGE